ncbi:MAG: DUF2970 domain-containing protein [Proteobacteria bacterium]|jgi:amino acid permease|nr:DUF2970 domain-containing protein [Pseudomonadota bacterium]MCG6935445.1 DUF2970 domain-containing protein [Pseudomonadota bacterium]
MSDNPGTPSLWDVAKSVFAAFLGVQKSANYQRDFQHGKPWQYIFLGLLFVAIFIFILVGVVMLVISLAGA